MGLWDHWCTGSVFLSPFVSCGLAPLRRVVNLTDVSAGSERATAMHQYHFTQSVRFASEVIIAAAVSLLPSNVSDFGGDHCVECGSLTARKLRRLNLWPRESRDARLRERNRIAGGPESRGRFEWPARVWHGYGSGSESLNPYHYPHNPYPMRVRV